VIHRYIPQPNSSTLDLLAVHLLDAHPSKTFKRISRNIQKAAPSNEEAANIHGTTLLLMKNHQRLKT